MIISLALNRSFLRTYVFIWLNLLYSIIIIIIALCILVFNAYNAFDRVNHWTMLKKLTLRGVPIIIVRILCFGIVLSNFVYNSTKQGHLFSLFLTVFDKAEYFPQNCFLFIWMICLGC